MLNRIMILVVFLVGMIALLPSCADISKPTGSERSFSGNINSMSMNSDVFFDVYAGQAENIPDDALVYGLADFYIGWLYFAPVYMCTWSEWECGYEYEAPVVTGAEYEASIYVLDEATGKEYVFAQGLIVNGTDLTYFRLGRDGYPVAAFRVETDGVSFPGTPNADHLYCRTIQYQGGDVGVPVECEERAEPEVSASHQIYVESDVFWGQSVKLDWNSEKGEYEKEFEVLAQGGTEDNYFVPTCSTELPYRRTFGVAVADTILHHLWKYSDGWYWHVCGFDPDTGDLLQDEENNLCSYAGLGGG